jgi:hypothetical protein
VIIGKIALYSVFTSNEGVSFKAVWRRLVAWEDGLTGFGAVALLGLGFVKLHDLLVEVLSLREYIVHL